MAKHGNYKLFAPKELRLRYPAGIIMLRKPEETEWTMGIIKYIAYDESSWEQYEDDELYRMDIRINGNIKDINLLEYIIKFYVPEMGLVNISDEAVYCCLTSKKQWVKLLNTHILMRVSVGMRPPKWSPAWAHNSKGAEELFYCLFNPEYFSLEAACELVINGDMYSCAISPEYAVGISPMMPNKLSLFRYKDPVGFVDNNDEGEYIIVLPSTQETLVEDVEQYGVVSVAA